MGYDCCVIKSCTKASPHSPCDEALEYDGLVFLKYALSPFPCSLVRVYIWCIF